MASPLVWASLLSQLVDAGAGVGIGQQQRRVLGADEVAQDDQLCQVLEHIGMVAGMEGVAVAEDDAQMVQGFARQGGCSRKFAQATVSSYNHRLACVSARGKSSTPPRGSVRRTPTVE